MYDFFSFTRTRKKWRRRSHWDWLYVAFKYSRYNFYLRSDQICVYCAFPGSEFEILTLSVFVFLQNVGTVRQLLYDFPWTNVGKLVFVVSQMLHQNENTFHRYRLFFFFLCCTEDETRASSGSRWCLWKPGCCSGSWKHKAPFLHAAVLS